MKTISLTTLALALMLASGCGNDAPVRTGPVSSVVSDDEAIAIAEVALNGYNQDDFAAFSARWDDAMRGAISESEFHKWRTEKLPGTGTFKSVLGVELVAAKKSGFVRYQVQSEFDKQEMLFVMIFPDNGTEIAGQMLLSQAEAREGGFIR